MQRCLDQEAVLHGLAGLSSKASNAFARILNTSPAVFTWTSAQGRSYGTQTRSNVPACEHIPVGASFDGETGGGQGQPKAPQKLLLVHTCNRKEGQQQCPACCAAPHGWLVCVCGCARVPFWYCLSCIPFFFGGVRSFSNLEQNCSLNAATTCATLI